MTQTKINASQVTITAEDIGASSAFDTMPTAAVGYLDKVVQYVGATDATYTNGYFYKCVSDGLNPATYSWSQVNVQPSGAVLPDATDNDYKFLMVYHSGATVVLSWQGAVRDFATGYDSIKTKSGNGTDARNAVGINNTYSANYCVSIGSNSSVMPSSQYSIAIGYNTESYLNSPNSVVIGANSTVNSSNSVAIGNKTGTGNNANYAIQLGSTASNNGYAFNNDANTFKVGNQSGNYEIMSADGTIPTDRFTTTPSADGTYTPTVTISSGVATRSWAPAASAPVVPSTMPTLAVADWSSNTQTVNVTGVTASNVVFVSPAPASAADYAAAGVVCTAQGAGTLTFTCTTVPSNAITVNVVILG